MTNDPDRTTRARRAAELALVRVANHYGGRPNFVLLGGLVPALLCSNSDAIHAGTTDVDVQVNLEIIGDARNAGTLEKALRNADFVPDSERVWRWETTQGGGYKAVIKFELVADLDDEPQNAEVRFDEAESLGAVNLRGTRYAGDDYEVRTLVAYDQGARIQAEVNVTGLAGFLLAKTAAAYGRHLPKDYYDIAFVLLHHNEVFHQGRSADPADIVLQKFGSRVELRSALMDLAANFADSNAQGVRAYVDQFTINNPSSDHQAAATDAMLAIAAFTGRILTAIENHETNHGPSEAQ